RSTLGVGVVERDVEETCGIGHRQRAEQHRIHQLKGRRRRTDRESKRQDGGGTDGSMFVQLPPAKPDVGEQCIEPGDTALIANATHRLRHAARMEASAAARLLRRLSPSPRVLGRELEMELQLLLEFAIVAMTTERAEQS